MTAQLKLMEPMKPAKRAKPTPEMVPMSAVSGPETVAIEVIQPKVAADWLRNYNTNNFRPMSPRTVEKYERDMEEGHWGLSSSTITLCVDKDGNPILGDGQHRLQACANTGIPIRQVVVRGASPADIMHTDRGRGRQFGDYLGWMGYAHPRTLSKTLKIWHTFQTDVDSISRPTATDDELYMLVQNRPDVVNAVEWAAKHSMGRGAAVRMTSSWLAVARALVMDLSALRVDEQKDPDRLEWATKARADADFFFARLIDHDTDQLPGLNHPIKQLLEVLYLHGSGSAATEKFENWKLLALVLKAWNRYRSGDHGARQLRVTLGGTGAEAFPRPI